MDLWLAPRPKSSRSSGLPPKTLRSIFITWLRDNTDSPEVLKAAAPGSQLAGAKPSATFGRSFLRDPQVAAAVRAAPPQPGLDGVDAEFIERFLESAADDEDDLIWSPDYKQALRRRHEARQQQAQIRLATQEPVELDPHLAEQAEIVHQAVLDASSAGAQG